MGCSMHVVVDIMEKKLEDGERLAKAAKWPKHCIFLVPPRFKMMLEGHEAAVRVYKPQTVALGPFHHDEKDLKPMEEHKLWAVRYLLERAGKKFDVLFKAVEEVAEDLEDAYMDLGGEWRGEKNRGKFLEMMITDGCFLLEVMRAADANPKHSSSVVQNYKDSDPVFSWHGIQHIKAFVQRDMLMVENQVPLRLLERIVEMEGTSPDATSINSMVLKFLLGKEAPEVTSGLGLHPLDIYRKSQLNAFCKMPPPAAAAARPKKRDVRARSGSGANTVVPARHPCSCFRSLLKKLRPEPPVVPRSAQKLSEAGIRFACSKTSRLDDIHFHNGRLEMPKVLLDDNTAYRFHNMMVFEAMHGGTSNDVTAYALFVKDLVDSADDVRLLAGKTILVHDLAADDAAVVALFNGLTRDVSKYWDSVLCGVRDDMENHYRSNPVRVFIYESLAHLRNKYFRSPWTVLALATAFLFVVTDLVQAVYAIISYDPNKGKLKRH